ncbi:MAG: hypothetical protein K8S16_12730 [Bacteroidales bacterium]|nr:hypothetical protein [Bacteroidales bacterium]
MTNFTSRGVDLEKSADFIFFFLSDFNHFEKLMPEQVTNWKSTNEGCSFTIQGMANIEMVIDTKVEFTKISYKSVGSSPLNFNLEFNIETKGQISSRVVIHLNADLNPMLKMMASRPLQNFVNMLAGKLKEVAEG